MEHVQPLADAPIEGYAQQDVLVRRDPVLFPEITFPGTEHRQIDAVVDNDYGVILQKGLLHQIGQPLRRRHDSQVKTCEQFFFLLIELAASVKEETVIAALGASRAPFLPFVTVNSVKIGAVGCERPAVVERPDQLGLVLFEVGKQ